MKPVGKPDALIGHVRFDERGWETGRRLSASARAHPRLYLESAVRSFARRITRYALARRFGRYGLPQQLSDWSMRRYACETTISRR